MTELEPLTEHDSKIREARRAAARRMRREQLTERRAYEAELERRGVPEQRRDRLLAEFEAEGRRRIREYERCFRANLRRRTAVP